MKSYACVTGTADCSAYIVTGRMLYMYAYDKEFVFVNLADTSAPGWYVIELTSSSLLPQE